MAHHPGLIIRQSMKSFLLSRLSFRPRDFHFLFVDHGSLSALKENQRSLKKAEFREGEAPAKPVSCSSWLGRSLALPTCSTGYARQQHFRLGNFVGHFRIFLIEESHIATDDGCLGRLFVLETGRFFQLLTHTSTSIGMCCGIR